jgi:hypothetical protein
VVESGAMVAVEIAPDSSRLLRCCYRACRRPNPVGPKPYLGIPSDIVIAEASPPSVIKCFQWKPSLTRDG